MEGVAVMKISIIIPCYNCSSTIRETIESLENQINKEFEVICVNDGSTDNTLDILEDIQRTTKLQMRVYSQINSGVSKTRNYGITLSNGEYILFLDADDIYNPYFTEQLFSAITTNNVDCAYCKLSRDFEKVRRGVYSKKIVKIESQKEAMRKLLYEMGSYGFYCYIYRKNVIEKNNLQFDENTKFFEDREFNWKYLCHCESFAWIDFELYGYRINLNSAVFQKMTLERCNKSLAAVKRTENYLETHNCEYVGEFKSYLYARNLWGIMKGASRSKDPKLFKEIAKHYNVKDCMRQLRKDKQALVRISARLYLINPLIFYWVTRIYALLKGQGVK